MIIAGHTQSGSPKEVADRGGVHGDGPRRSKRYLRAEVIRRRALTRNHQPRLMKRGRCGFGGRGIGGNNLAFRARRRVTVTAGVATGADAVGRHYLASHHNQALWGWAFRNGGYHPPVLGSRQRRHGHMIPAAHEGILRRTRVAPVSPSAHVRPVGRKNEVLTDAPRHRRSGPAHASKDGPHVVHGSPSGRPKAEAQPRGTCSGSTCGSRTGAGAPYGLHQGMRPRFRCFCRVNIFPPDAGDG